MLTIVVCLPHVCSGSFGDIYLGTHITTQEEVAIKLESCKSRHPQLAYEYRLYRILQNKTGTVAGIPNVRWFGKEGDYNVLVMDLLGPSLEDLFNYCNRRFTLKTVLMLAEQLISRIEYIHCVVGSTPVDLADGTSRCIEELYKELQQNPSTGPFELMTYDEHASTGSLKQSVNAGGFTITRTAGASVVTAGRKQCFEVLFDDGRTLSLTGDHRVQTARGLVNASDLIIGSDRIIAGASRTLHSRNFTYDQSAGFELHMSHALGRSLAWSNSKGQSS